VDGSYSSLSNAIGIALELISDRGSVPFKTVVGDARVSAQDAVSSVFITLLDSLLSFFGESVLPARGVPNERFSLEFLHLDFSIPRLRLFSRSPAIPKVRGGRNCQLCQSLL